jgi:hypothetical protein
MEASNHVQALICSLINSSCDISLIDPVCAIQWSTVAQEICEACEGKVKKGEMGTARMMREELGIFLEVFSRYNEKIPFGGRC